MKMKIRKIGCSAMVALAQPMLETLGLEIGDFADVKAINENQILITRIERNDKNK